MPAADNRPRPCVAVVLAGGSGSRFGAAVPKQLLPVAGRPVLLHVMDALDAARNIDEIVLVAPAGALPVITELLADRPSHRVRRIVAGGATRDASTCAGLAAIPFDDADVLVHDAARPLVTPELIDRCATALAAGAEAVLPAVSSTDTIAVVADGSVADVPSRDRLVRAQTPQGFRLEVLRRAYDLAAADPAYEGTDNVGVVRRFLPEVAIRVVAGDPNNVKITAPEDLVVVEALLRARTSQHRAE